MQLNDNEFDLCTLCCRNDEMKDSIIITKESLEKWRDHYVNKAYEAIGMWTNGLYSGKIDVLSDLLKHFEKE